MVAVAASAVAVYDLHLISADPFDAIHVFLGVHVAALPDDTPLTLHELSDFSAGLRSFRIDHVVALDDVLVPIDRIAEVSPGSRGVAHIATDIERRGMDEC